MTGFIYPPYDLIAGVDEVGRGPLVGDVVTAAVIVITSYSIHYTKLYDCSISKNKSKRILV